MKRKKDGMKSLAIEPPVFIVLKWTYKVPEANTSV